MCISIESVRFLFCWYLVGWSGVPIASEGTNIPVDLINKGCIKLPPPPGGDRIKLVEKGIKLGRREGKKEERNGMEEGKGKARQEGKGKWKRRE